MVCYAIIITPTFLKFPFRQVLIVFRSRLSSSYPAIQVITKANVWINIFMYNRKITELIKTFNSNYILHYFPKSLQCVVSLSWFFTRNLRMKTFHFGWNVKRTGSYRLIYSNFQWVNHTVFVLDLKKSIVILTKLKHQLFEFRIGSHSLQFISR